MYEADEPALLTPALDPLHQTEHISHLEKMSQHPTAVSWYQTCTLKNASTSHLAMSCHYNCFNII